MMWRLMIMIKNNSEFLYLFEAIMTNPNGDPDQENRPRMDNETKTLLVSDVRRKRDIRDFLYHKGYDIFVNTLDDKKVEMKTMFNAIKEKYGVGEKDDEKTIIDTILNNLIDIRMFGSAMAIKDEKGAKSFTGPVQLSWGYSLHPVDIVKSNSIVTIMNEDNSTFGKMYKVHYALVAYHGSINKFAAQKTKMTESDRDVFRRSLVQSMMNNLTHSKQGQAPSLYLEIVYNESFDGYVGDLRRFIDVNTDKNVIRKMEDLKINFDRLSSVIEDMKKNGYIKDVFVWKSPYVNQFNNLPKGTAIDVLKPFKSR